MKIIIFALFVFMLFFSSCSKDEKIIGLKQNIHHDDFEYSVLNVEKAESIGTVKTNGVFYLVTFQVENKAKRVGHEWNNSIAYLVDETGKEYENSYSQQMNLKNVKLFPLNEKYNTSAGQSDSTILVFEVPSTAKEVYLKVHGDFLMGDMFDGNQFKNTKVKLF